jgi:tetratricopeptide (TPR) repeat protein
MIKTKHQVVLAIIILIVSIVLAYRNTFTVPFILDDTGNILENSSIHSLWPPWQSFVIPKDTGIVGRSVINFSLAVNYAISGYNVWSYHAVNLIIHILAALTLFGVIRQTLLPMEKTGLNIGNPVFFSFACALLWGLHPLQTQAVTYIIQRCESLMALFFLLTFYSAIRGWQVLNSRFWHLLAIMFFLLAVSSKEVAAVVPVLLLLYEWMFMGRNPMPAMKKSPFLYSGLALGLLTVIVLLLKGNTLLSRTEHSDSTLLNYIITQCPVILHYLRLSVWPTGLTIDYGWPIAAIKEAWPAIVLIISLIGLTSWALWRRNSIGFLGACFFIILLPTSVVPLADIAVAHRIYLPLAAVVILFTGIVFNIFSLKLKHPEPPAFYKAVFTPAILIALILCLGLTLGFMTYQRNYDYKSAIAIWSDTIEKRPLNYRGYHGLGIALSAQCRHKEGLEYMLKALKLNPDSAILYNDTGFVLLEMNRPTQALPYLLRAVQLRAHYPQAYNNIGGVFVQTGQLNQAIYYFSEALRQKPDYLTAYNNFLAVSAMLKRKSSQQNVGRSNLMKEQRNQH